METTPLADIAWMVPVVVFLTWLVRTSVVKKKRFTPHVSLGIAFLLMFTLGPEMVAKALAIQALFVGFSASGSYSAVIKQFKKGGNDAPK